MKSVFDAFFSEEITYTKTKKLFVINVEDIIVGISQNKDFIFHRKDGLIKIYDRVCDHNGGRLSVKGKSAVCPLHGWQLDVESSSYINAQCAKLPLLTVNEQELESSLIEIPAYNEQIRSQSFNRKINIEVTFINHACLLFEVGDNLSFATDPWVLGSAFCNGWWLSKKSPADVFDKLNKCDFIYISHNHPDHLHTLSLSHIRKDMPILTGGFKSRSTCELLEQLGFNFVCSMDFSSSLIDLERQVAFSVLKSGDFRDDSGLFVEIGEFKCLLTVDSNFLNFGRLPDKVDLICSSFASGASGFPLCFSNYSEDDKAKIVLRNKSAIKVSNLQNIKNTGARYFMPYAGFFSEKADRDKYIKERNEKNSIEEYEHSTSSLDCQLLNLNVYQIYTFKGSELVKEKRNDGKELDEASIAHYIESTENYSKEELKRLMISYFQGSVFNDNLVLDLVATDESFEFNFVRLAVDFSGPMLRVFEPAINFTELETECLSQSKRYLQIKVRKDELGNLINNGKPFEDISIGFQCRVYRNPNVYNSEFWFYYTNQYIGSRVKRFFE